MNSKEALELAILEYEKETIDDENNQWVKNVLKGLKKCKQDLERLEKLEKFKKLCLTKYVPLDSLSPSFWRSKKEWLEDMSYDYYLYLCEDVCEYVVKDNQKLTPKEFKLIYELLKEMLNE